MRNPDIIDLLERLKHNGEHIGNDIEDLSSITSAYVSIFMVIWRELMILWFILLTSISLFPGLALATNSYELSYSWFVTFMVLIFNTADFIGRYIPSYILVSTRLIFLLSLAKCIFIFTFIMIAEEKPPGWLFGAIWFKMINIFIFTLSYGYLSTAIIMRTFMKVPARSKERVGYTISTIRMLGILSGSLLALSFTRLGSKPEND
jgi:hypothetical protein